MAETAWALGMSRTRPDGGPSLPVSGDKQAAEDVALGRHEITPVDLLRGYATLENGGRRQDLYLVREVRDSHGKVLYRHRSAAADQAIGSLPARLAGDALTGLTRVAPISMTADGRYVSDPAPRFATTASVPLNKTDLRDAWAGGCAPRFCAVS